MKHRAHKGSPVRLQSTCIKLAAVAAMLFGAPALAATGANATLPPAVSQMVQRANDAQRRGDLRVAILLLKNAVEAAPRQAAIRAQLGSVLVMQGDYPEAERTLRDARSQGAPDSAVLPALYQAMLNRQEGQALLQEFGEPAPSDHSAVAADTIRARALAYYALKNQQAANAEIDKALALHRSPQALADKAQFAVAAGDLAAATNLIDEALHIAPGDQRALIIKIGLLERSNDYAGALNYANTLVKAFPSQTEPRVLRIDILTKLRKDKDVAADINWLLAASPNLPIALYDRALLEARRGDMKGAWRIIQALPPAFLSSSPQFGLAAAQIARASGNDELGDTMLLAVVGSYPDNEEARLQLAAKRLQQKNPKQALDLLKPITAQDARFFSLMAQTYQALGQAAQAQDYVARANLAGVKSGLVQASPDRLLALNLKYPADTDVANALLGVLIRQGNNADAQKVVDRFAAAAKNDAMAQFFSGEVLMSRGDLDGANQAFTAFLKSKPGNAPALFYLAEVASARGDRTGANADLDALLKANPNDAQAMARKAEYALEMGDATTGETLLEQAVKAAPQDPSPQLALASFYLSRKDYAKSQSLAATLLARWPNDVRAANLMIQIQFAQGATDAAKNTAIQFAQKSPSSEAAAILLGDVLDRVKDQGALGAYQNAVRVGHDSPSANLALINYLLRSGDKNKAVDLARAYASRHAGVDSDVMLAQALIASGRKDDAKVVLTTAQTRPKNSRGAQALARLQGELTPGKDKAILLDWLKTNPDDIAARAMLANLYLADGNLESAQRQLEPVVRVQPYNTDALNDLAWTLQKSDPARAVKLAAEAARIAPRSAEILDTLAWLKWQQNDRSGSLPLLRRANELNPQEPNIAYHLAVALQATGDKPSAVKVLNAAIKANPTANNKAELQRLEAQWQ